MHAFYSELARWWPLISPVSDYEAEAHEVMRWIDDRNPEARTMLELGSGGGHNAFYLKRRFDMTLTDVSQGMLEVSSALNPDCEHLLGDMRTLNLARSFDVVFAHDAVDYMTTEAEVLAALQTARRHLGPSGLAVFVPDVVRERFEPGIECGGNDGPDGAGIRYLEWTPGVAASDTTGTTHYSFLVREANGEVRSVHEAHVFGLFPQRTWERLFEQCGFAVEVVEERTEDQDRTPRVAFVGRVPRDAS